MSTTLHAFTTDGHVVISFPEQAIPAQQREDFIAFMKTEWIARQSKFSEEDAKTLAEETDSDWWARNRQRIMRVIGES